MPDRGAPLETPGGRYRARVVDRELDALLPALPAVALEGAKAVGKTATALQRAATVYRLDDPGSRAIVDADPARVVSHGATPILIDEWQHLPAVWDVVRRAVDVDARPGQFLLTGSAAPSQPPTHSGAGRIVSLRMRPLALSERALQAPSVSLRDLLSGERRPLAGTSAMTLADYAREIAASGFPGLRHLHGRALRAQLDGYLARVVDHDFEEAGLRIRNPGTLTRWMTAYAAATSTTASLETIRDAATSGQGDKPARSTTLPYRDVLERLFVVEPVPGWAPTRNPIARVATPLKHQLVDPALAVRLLGADEEALLDARPLGPPLPRDGTLLGALFESLVALSVRVYAQAAECSVGHLRTKGGEREVDLVVVRGDQRAVAIEVKLGRTVTDRDVAHLVWLQRQLGEELLDALVITTGAEAYRRSDGIGVVPAALLGP